MTDYIRLTDPPKWCVQYPTCSACSVDLETEGDGWTCPVCGSSWGMDASDGDAGTLYSDWSGESATGPVVANEHAHLWGYYHEQMEAHRLVPNLVREPKRPNTLQVGDR